MTRYRFVESPVGRLLVAGDEEGLRAVLFQQGPKAAEPEADWELDEGVMPEAVEQLAEYFAGERREFSVKVAPRGTAFQLRVWQELQRIEYGETISYGELATRVGNPKASRAVGLANGQNPISIIVPCHRVVGANGKLTGYGGGLPIKEALLRLEKGRSGLFGL
ncbi:MAG: methylated-DNA--[protein]-cysteine S-methyltransferase [Bryobacterales bacterium]|nr:methylated-DNA--[protein]-cysteine S-methyltransferase [Bryobacterales bacterium]